MAEPGYQAALKGRLWCGKAQRRSKQRGQVLLAQVSFIRPTQVAEGREDRSRLYGGHGRGLWKSEGLIQSSCVLPQDKLLG